MGWDAIIAGLTTGSVGAYAGARLGVIAPVLFVDNSFDWCVAVASLCFIPEPAARCGYPWAR